MDKFCIASQKQSFNTVLFSAQSVNSSIEDLSNTMDFVLRGWKEDMAQISENVFPFLGHVLL